MLLLLVASLSADMAFMAGLVAWPGLAAVFCVLACAAAAWVIGFERGAREPSIADGWRSHLAAALLREHVARLALERAVLRRDRAAEESARAAIEDAEIEEIAMERALDPPPVTLPGDEF